jgi:hypothetical protein
VTKPVVEMRQITQRLCLGLHERTLHVKLNAALAFAAARLVANPAVTRHKPRETVAAWAYPVHAIQLAPIAVNAKTTTKLMRTAFPRRRSCQATIAQSASKPAAAASSQVAYTAMPARPLAGSPSGGGGDVQGGMVAGR